jgi:hypothetical protein
MRRALLGITLAGLTGLLVTFGAALGAMLPVVALLGVLLGAVAALAPGRSFAIKAASLLTGMAFVWVAYAVRAAALPDIPAARGLVAAVLVLALIGLAAASRDRLPLIGLFSGAALAIGAYDPMYRVDPTAFLVESPTALIAAGLAALVGLTVMHLGTLTASVAPTQHDDAPATADVRQDDLTLAR